MASAYDQYDRFLMSTMDWESQGWGSDVEEPCEDPEASGPNNVPDGATAPLALNLQREREKTKMV